MCEVEERRTARPTFFHRKPWKLGRNDSIPFTRQENTRQCCFPSVQGGRRQSYTHGAISLIIRVPVVLWALDGGLPTRVHLESSRGNLEEKVVVEPKQGRGYEERQVFLEHAQTTQASHFSNEPSASKKFYRATLCCFPSEPNTRSRQGYTRCMLLNRVASVRGERSKNARAVSTSILLSITCISILLGAARCTYCKT